MMPRNVRTWFSLRGNERRLFLRALVGLTKIDLELRLRGFRGVFRSTEMRSVWVPKEVGPAELARAQSYARWLDVASRHHVIPARCLHRSLVLHQWLRDEGLPSRLQIGVRKDGSEVTAHAWVELAGHVVSDRPAVAQLFQSLGDLSSGSTANFASSGRARNVKQDA